VELLITMMVMGIVATSVMMVAFRAFTDTATITNRRDVLADGRFALDMLSKQLRQGESVDQTVSCPPVSASNLKFSGYVDGTAKTIIWRATGSSAPYELQYSLTGGPPYATVLSELQSASFIESCTVHGGVVDQVTISLSLGTRTATVVMSTDVELRNAQT
jgi:hypothetical protein